MYIQRDPGGLAQGFVDLDLDNSPGLWAATVATYCTIRMVEHPKSKSTKPQNKEGAEDPGFVCQENRDKGTGLSEFGDNQVPHQCVKGSAGD